MMRGSATRSVAFLLLLACCDDPAGLDDAPGVILLTKHDGGNLAELWTIRPDGSDARQLTSNNSIESDASWSPDGARIVFTRMNDTTTGGPTSRFEIHVMNADGSAVQKLTDVEVSDEGPRWSPDGNQIVFSRRFGTDSIQLFVMNADGSSARALYTGTGSKPDWSPDGSKILFIANSKLHVMNANGTNVEPLGGDAACAGIVRGARWSPDGARIAYTCEAGSGYGIFTMRADGTDVVNIRQPVIGGGVIGVPLWSPDGRFIAFGRNDGMHDIFVIRSTGGSETRITNDGPADLVSDWGRPR